MALPVQDQAKYWGVVALLFMLALWFLGDVLLPFIVGGAIAYMMDPVADRLERMKFSRVAATATISLLAILVIVPVMIFVIREVTEQTAALLEQAPKYLSSLYTYLSNRFPALLDSTSTLSKTIWSRPCSAPPWASSTPPSSWWWSPWWPSTCCWIGTI